MNELLRQARTTNEVVTNRLSESDERLDRRLRGDSPPAGSRTDLRGGSRTPAQRARRQRNPDGAEERGVKLTPPGPVVLRMMPQTLAEISERNRRAAAATARFIMQTKGHETRCVTGHDGVTRVQAGPRRDGEDGRKELLG